MATGVGCLEPPPNEKGSAGPSLGSGEVGCAVEGLPVAKDGVDACGRGCLKLGGCAEFPVFGLCSLSTGIRGGGIPLPFRPAPALSDGGCDACE